MLHCLGISNFPFPLGIRLQLWGIPLTSLHLHFLCPGTRPNLHVLPHLTLALLWPIKSLEPCYALSLSLVRSLACPGPSVRQSTATIMCRCVRRTLAYFFCLLCVLLAQSNCNVSHWHIGSGCNSTSVRSTLCEV